MKPEQFAQRLADEEMLNSFLAKWPIDSLNQITLQQYNSVGDRETFCQYVETKTRPLGSIKGRNSTKFGIYKMANTQKQPQGTVTDGVYAWVRKYNPVDTNKSIAFNNVLKEVQAIANCAAIGDFETIESFGLTSLFKWKVAFLYSGSRLIPIFSKLNLIQIVNNLGMSANYHTPYYQMQEFLMARKPVGQTVVEFMRYLYHAHRMRLEKILKGKKPTRKRRAVSGKSTAPQQRSGHEAYTAGQFHNEIQLALYDQLCNKYGKPAVQMEYNWVDILVELPDKVILYEIKSDRYASDCILNGLGQILGYAADAAKLYQKKIELVIAGANEGFDNELETIKYVFKQVKLPVSYLKIDY